MSAGRLRALFTDLDGTLLGPGGSLFATESGEVSTRAAEAVASLHRVGVRLVLVSGRTRDQLREAARILGASAYIAEMGAFVVTRPPEGGPEEVVPNLGAFSGSGTPFEAMARTGAGAFLLERYAGRLEPHAPWAFAGREATMLLRGLVDPAEAGSVLAEAGYGWLEVVDNGLLRRSFEGLDLPEVRAYHLLPKGVSKLSAVRLHLQREGLDPSACAAIGDAPSDLALAGAVSTVYIVANGLEAVGGAIGFFPNVRFTDGAGPEGFAEATAALLGG